MSPRRAGAALEFESCARERIHRLGLIQPHGVVLLCHPEDGRVECCSANAEAVLGVPAEALVGRTLQQVLPDVHALLHEAVDAIAAPGTAPPRIERRVPVAGAVMEAGVHRHDDRVIVELQAVREERGHDPQRTLQRVDAISQRLLGAPDAPQLLEVAVEELRALCGYRRVMAYAFDSEWNGEVLAESTAAGEPQRYLGLHFPASDIPPQARRLYEQSLFRAIADVDAEAVPFVSAPGAATADEPPDLSYCLLRSVSAMHLRYLRNMQVRASLSVSLMVDGRLWGLLVAHDDAPHVPPTHVVHALRMVCSILGQLIGSRLLAMEFQAARSTSDALMDLLDRFRDGRRDERTHRLVRRHAAKLRGWFEADGLVARIGDEIVAHGALPEDRGLGLMAHCLARSPHAAIDCDSLAQEGLGAVASGFAGAFWLPLDDGHSGLLFVRRERRIERRWGGDPQRPVDAGDDGTVLGPRRSFAIWTERQSGRCLPWRTGLHEGARRLAAQLNGLMARDGRKVAEDRTELLLSGLSRVNDALMIARVESDGSLVVIFTNDAFASLMAPVENGATPAFLDPRFVAPAHLESVRAVIGSRAPGQVEIPFQREGGALWVQLVLAPLIDQGGRLTHWIAVERDITGRKREEQRTQLQSRALRDANERFDRILSTSQEGILALDEDGTIDYANRRMVDLLGTAQALEGRRFEALLAHPHDALRLFRTAQGKAQGPRLEVELTGADGVPQPFELAAIPLRRSASQRPGWLVMARDMGEQRRLEQSLMQLNSSLEQKVAERTAELVAAKESADLANRAKSEFLANMSHELRSPLHGILGFTRLVLDDADIDGPQRETYLRKVVRNAGNLLALVNDLLDSAKIESQSFSISPSACDLVDVVRGVIGEFQGEGSATAPIDARYPASAPIEGDPLRLAQVVRNLLANAIRFSPPERGVALQVERADVGWRIEVADGGPGIPDEELELIFDRFAQSSKTKSGAGGTGLGLYIARGIIDAHGGRLWAENRSGGGARFVMTLPGGPPAA